MSAWGLNTLRDFLPGGGRDESIVDIVAVHSLGSDQSETWTDTQTGVLWLRDLLPYQLLPSRVLAFNYKADASTFFGDDSNNRILQHAHTLVAGLEAVRALSNTAERPIIFICHGLGGIITKKALTYSASQTSKNVEHLYSIFISTYGILFMGTPHEGIEETAWRSLSKRNHFKFNAHKPYPNPLDNKSETLQNITDGFAPLVKQFHLFFFWEGIETDLGSVKSYVVQKDSAAPIWDNTERSRIHATHAQMCKFADGDSTDFKTVLAALCRYAREAHPIIKSRWIHARRLLATQRTIEASELIGFDAHNHNTPFLCESPKIGEENTAKGIRNKHFYVPHNVSSIFTGREIITQVLRSRILDHPEHEILREQKRFVLYGLGGSGKTQFCLKFVQDNRDSFWGIFWVDASSVENAESTLAQIGRLGGLDESYGAVIDNADDPSVDYSKFFPAGNRGHILVTTRNSDCRIHATIGSYEFNDMDEEDSISLLLKAAQLSDVNDVRLRELARPIVRTLGCLALALIQAGASIRQGICSLEEYLEIFALYKKQIMSDQLVQGADTYRYTIYTTWEVSVQMIERLSSEKGKDAIELLQVIAFLHFEQVPLSMFERAWNISHRLAFSDVPQSSAAHLLDLVLSIALIAWIIAIVPSFRSRWRPQQLPSILHQSGPLWNVVRFREAIRLLSNFSLINKDAEKDTYSVHPMVHFWARERLAQQDQQTWSNVATTILTNSITPQFEASDLWYRRSLLPHIESCLQKDSVHPILPSKLYLQDVTKFVKFAAIYSECGKWEKAISLQEKVLEAYTEALGKEHPETLQAMTALAWSYWNFKRPSKALGLQRTVLELSSKALGGEDTRTLKAMDTLAATYWLCGQRVEAEKLGQKAMDGLVLRLGPGHPDSLTAMENLGRTYMHRGRYRAAQDLQSRVLATRSKMYGPSHPDTLMAMANLGMTHHALRNLEDAEKLLMAVTEKRKQVLGQEHAYTLWAINDLSRIYVDQKRPHEAEELLTGILEVVTRTLGNDHIGMSMTLMNLARAFNGQGKWTDSQRVLTDLIPMQQRTLGPEHPDTIIAEAELARTLRHLGCLDVAEKMSVDAVEKLTRVMGADHAWTQRAMGQLSAIYIVQGRADHAAELDAKMHR